MQFGCWLGIGCVVRRLVDRRGRSSAAGWEFGKWFGSWLRVGCVVRRLVGRLGRSSAVGYPPPHPYPPTATHPARTQPPLVGIWGFGFSVFFGKIKVPKSCWDPVYPPKYEVWQSSGGGPGSQLVRSCEIWTSRISYGLFFLIAWDPLSYSTFYS